MSIDIKATKSRNIKYMSLSALAMSIIVIGLWLFNIRAILYIIPGVTPMEFITALSFFLLSVGVLAAQRKSTIFLIINRATITCVLIIALVTIGQDLFGNNFGFNTSFVNDTYALKFPGRMSLATAICFFLAGISTWGMDSKSEKIKRFTNFIYLAVILLNFVTVIIFILNIPGNDAGFLIPIPIHTSLVLFLYSGYLFHKNATVGLNRLVLGKYAGSRVVRTVVPYNFAAIMIMGLIYLYLINNNITDANTGFIIYSIFGVFAACVYPFVIAIQLNHSQFDKNTFEKAFRASMQETKQYKEALDASSLVDITDANGTIISVNDKFCETSNYERNELIGNTHKFINSGHHSKEFFAELWTTIKSGEVWSGGIRNKTKDGVFYWVHTAIIPFINEFGEIYQFLTIRQDITKHTLLSTQYESLKAKNKEIEQFTFIASHDLQEPLRTVRSMIDILQEEYSLELDEDALMSLNFMTEATDRMSSLIKGLLDYSRIGREKELITIDSNETVREITDDLAAIIKRKNTVITTDKLPILKAYGIEIRLLFQNLISNAIKFQKEGATPRIHISAKEDTNYFKFSVKDNGIGIPEEDSRNVFAIFQRLNKRDAYEGTGIGLAHCEKIVHLHGGEIWVDSKENEGSTFNFTILKNFI
ncbi:sensor histidine kinase [Kriegella aquimaris]|uniref:histidine kinase n=1 Tax=Kriegella aquimaris TaxID=192904 RepID=A0A1G9TV82_9FLAO|nr:ATP-binding protein [Kriegella aquimaris]SDM51700.1 PAS domain S-box-containing protein [Kriegella aquimaris]